MGAVIEAVLFDFGGVILTSPFDAFAAYETEAGLPPDTIRRINATDPDTNAWARFERREVGPAEFCSLFEVDAAELRRRVTSPGGTTQAAIESFQAGGFEALVETALGAAAHRSAEMAEQLGK